MCEYRVDKAARKFTRISKHSYPINTKRYCFEHYPGKLRPKRTYAVIVRHCYFIDICTFIM